MEVIRLAGYNERRCIARDCFGLYGSIVFVATYTCSQIQASLRDEIINALEKCVAKHQVLRAVILDAQTEAPQVAALPSIDVSEHLRFTDDDDLKRLLEQEHNRPYLDVGVKPQWRVVVCLLSGSRFQLAFSCSHALADGNSGFVFHAAFLQALREGKGTTSTRDVEETPVLLPLDRIAKMPISWSFLLAPLLGEYLPKFLARWLGFATTLDAVDAAAWVGSRIRPQKPTPPELLRTNLRLLSIPHASVQRVLAACRAKQVRLTGLLVRLFARSLSNALRARGQEYTKFVAGCAIDLRRALGQGKGCIANFPSGISGVHNIVLSEQGTPLALTAEDWDAAKKTTEHLVRASNTHNDQPIALLKYLSAIRPWVLKQVEKSAEGSYDISNLGVFPEPFVEAGQEDWKVEDIVFAQSADGTRGPMNVNVASTKEGALNLVVTWWPRMLGVEDEGVFVEEALGSVRTMIGGIV